MKHKRNVIQHIYNQQTNGIIINIFVVFDVQLVDNDYLNIFDYLDEDMDFQEILQCHLQVILSYMDTKVI